MIEKSTEDGYVFEMHRLVVYAWLSRTSRKTKFLGSNSIVSQQLCLAILAINLNQDEMVVTWMHRVAPGKTIYSCHESKRRSQ